MSCYVDDMKARFGGMVMCHLVADSRPELMAMADRIGLPRKWIQKLGTDHEHFDVCLAKRALAIKAGAHPISQRELGRQLIARRTTSPTARPLAQVELPLSDPKL